MPGRLRPGVLLDRDGTLNRKAPEGAYVASPDEVELLPGAAAAVAALTAAGLIVAVVTNQRGVARGLMSHADVNAVHARIDLQLVAAGGRVARWYVCPHEEGACGCRKPLPGLLLRAVAELGLDPSRTWMVGDAASDMAAATAAGLPAVRLGPAGTDAAGAVSLAPDLAAAVTWLLASDDPARNAGQRFGV